MCLKFASYVLYNSDLGRAFLLVYSTTIIKMKEKFHVCRTKLNLSFVIFILLEGTRTGMKYKKCKQN